MSDQDRLGHKALRIDPTLFGGHQCVQTWQPKSSLSLETLLSKGEEFTATFFHEGTMEYLLRRSWSKISKGDLVTTSKGKFDVVSVVVCRTGTGSNLVFVVPHANISKPD